ncbi:hypothetical protein HRbin10_01217 [bacterium HR10]|nr:hypothetical protein HRbin10_01217 [bacterium HR10]
MKLHRSRGWSKGISLQMWEASLRFYPPKRNRLFVRFEVGDAIVRFGSRTSWTAVGPIRSERFTGHNLQFSFGLGLRF